jgi:selenocysteine lyase/cysteine desulfurase
MNTPIKTFFTEEEIKKFRDETTGCRFVNHLNNAGAGLMPDVVTRAILEHTKLEAQLGGYEASDAREEAILDFYNQAALLINAKPTNIAFTASATDSFSRALSSIPFQAGDTILTDRDDFISNQVQFLSLEKRLGVKLVRVNNAEEGGIDLNDLQEKLQSIKPKLLAITHIPTNSGQVQPAEKIATIWSDFKKDHLRSWYILDVCQSIGQRNINVQKLKCDFLSVTNRKFLRGPRGTGFLYISDETLADELEPMFIDMRGADWTSENKYQQQKTAKRFEDWEFAYSLVIGSAKAIEYCRNAGIDKITGAINLLSTHLRSSLANNSKIRLLEKSPDVSSSVTLTVAGLSPDKIVNELRSKHINVVASYRQFAVLDFNDKNVDWAIRVSPHYYNTIDEVNTFVSEMNRMAS